MSRTTPILCLAPILAIGGVSSLPGCDDTGTATNESLQDAGSSDTGSMADSLPDSVDSPPLGSDTGADADADAGAEASICADAGGPSLKDGYLDIHPGTVFPSPTSILPSGVVYADTVPDTLDLAERAGRFIRGEVSTSIASLYHVPAHAIFAGLVPGETHDPFCKTIPCLWPDAGDWGLEMLAMARARQMTAFDRDDAAGTVSGHYEMLVNLFDVEAQKVVEAYTGPGLLKPAKIGKEVPGFETETAPQVPITASTFGMEALMAYLDDAPDSCALRAAIDGFAQMHQDLVNHAQSGGGTFSYYFDLPMGGYDSSEQGYVPVYPVFIQGRAAYGLLSLHRLTGDPGALTLGRDLLVFLQQWVPPYSNTMLLPANGEFHDHMYSEEQGVFALIADATLRRAANPADPVAQQELATANNIYTFIKSRTLAGMAGNFGETGTSGEMIRLAIKLTDLEVGSYFDEAEYWVRNQLAEEQISAADGVGGMFYSDATHPFAIPTNAKNFRYNVDGSANAILAMYDVWTHIVEEKGSTALVHFLLNRAARHITVRSDLPYRGRVEAQTAPELGSLTALAIRVPNWADHASVSVTRKTTGGETVLAAGTDWVWAGTYVYIHDIQPSSAYAVHFPIKIATANVYQMRSDSQFWYEGSFPTATGPEEQTVYSATFRGYELVDALPKPAYPGIALYQRQSLAALPPSDVAPPTHAVNRFVYHGDASSIPIPLP